MPFKVSSNAVDVFRFECVACVYEARGSRNCAMKSFLGLFLMVNAWLRRTSLLKDIRVDC